MEALGKIIRGLASIPLIGGALVFVLGFLPLLIILPLNLSNGLSMILGGLLMAAWCYFLYAKKLINIVTPLIPIPLWILGVVMAIAGVYGIITNKWDDENKDGELATQEITSPKDVSVPALEPESVSIQNSVDANDLEEDEESLFIDVDKIKDENPEEALEQMEAYIEDMKIVKQMVGQEKLDEIFKSQGNPENSMTFDEAIAQVQKQIDDLRSQGYGAKNSE